MSSTRPGSAVPAGPPIVQMSGFLSTGVQVPIGARAPQGTIDDVEGGMATGRRRRRGSVAAMTAVTGDPGRPTGAGSTPPPPPPPPPPPAGGPAPLPPPLRPVTPIATFDG